jgi:excisionase family DNA binding protein
MTEKRNQEQLLTVVEAAKALAMSEKSVWNFIYQRRITSVLIGRSRRIPASAVQDLVERGTVPAVQ